MPQGKRTTRRPSTRRNRARPVRNTDEGQPSPPGGASRQAQARIAELEAELASAQKTIRALLDKAEQRSASVDNPGRDVGPDRVAQGAEEGGPALEAELPGGVSLDKVVRQRTRALFESEEQLRRKNAELKRLNDMKGEFISIAAHELRTPLTSIVGYLDLVAEGRFGPVPKALDRPIRAVRRNGHRLTRLVEEMLDVSRIEAGRSTVKRTRCRLDRVVTDVVEELRPFASLNEQTLVTEFAPLPALQADEDKIHQVALNLVASAIRHTPQGGDITIAVDVAPPEQYAGEWARLRVLYSGPGIPAHQRHRIFEPFSDLDSAKHHTSSGPGSAGLGLYIARGLVDLHGGFITVDSAEGEFTEFTVLLPMSAQSAPR